MKTLPDVILEVLAEYKHADLTAPETRTIIAGDIADKVVEYARVPMRTGRRRFDRLREILIRKL